MKCRLITADGLTAIVCGSRFGDDAGYCEFCAERGTLLCDWKMGKGTAVVPAATCDKRMCAKHAQEVAPDKHLCPAHQAAWAQWQAQRDKRVEGGAAA